MMLIRSALIVTAVLVIVVDIQQTSFALHDSNLDVNTWIAQDNSTQGSTIDLNTPINQTVSGGAEQVLMQPLQQNLSQPQHQMMKEKMRKNLHQTTEREMKEMKKPMRNKI